MKKKPVHLRKKRSTDQQQQGRGFGLGFPYGGLNGGGITNPVTGMGTTIDKSESIFYEPTRVTTRTELEILYAQSWACKAFIDYPIDDMMIRWREFDDIEDDVADVMRNQEQRFKVRSRLARAMKSARLYGTGLLILMTGEADLSEPLDMSRVMQGDLYNLLAVDRFDAWVTRRNANPWSQSYGSAEQYGINLKNGGTLLVDSSRVLRFDGQEPLSMTGWYNYEQDWGVSEVIPVLRSILQEDSIAAATSHMAQECLIDIIKMKNFEDVLAPDPDPDEMTLAQRAQATTMGKSIYRMLFMDADDDYERKSYTFSGLPDLMDRHAKRLAAAARIPATRFWGQSPLGLNATGEADMVNYAMQVSANQNRLLSDPLTTLDCVLAADAGLYIDEPYKYHWPSLIDISEADQADTLLKKVQAAVAGVGGGIIDENEARKIVDGDPLAGNLEGLDTPTMPQTPEEMAALLGDALPYGATSKNGRIMFRAPAGAKANAKKVLAWKEKYGNEVKGMTAVGWKRARQLANGELLSPETVGRMSAFARHEKNSAVDPKFKSEPWKDNGRVAWLGWGGSSGVKWAKRAYEWYKKRGK